MNFRNDNSRYQTPQNSHRYYDNSLSNNNNTHIDKINNNNLSHDNPKKKNISYDDILNSMNVRVENGVLKFAVDKNTLPQQNIQEENFIELNGYDNTNNNLNGEKKVKQVKFSAPVEPEVKNSWIYNKYFKKYKDESFEEERKVPQTKEEYTEMVVRNYLNKLNAVKMVNQVKSKKLLFSNNNTQIQQPIQINNNKLNKLFKF